MEKVEKVEKLESGESFCQKWRNLYIRYLDITGIPQRVRSPVAFDNMVELYNQLLI